MTRQVSVGFSFNRETDSYEAKCPWCEEVVRSHSVEEITKVTAAVPTETPLDLWIHGRVMHDCPVEP